MMDNSIKGVVAFMVVGLTTVANTSGHSPSSAGRIQASDTVTTATMLHEMTDLNRLTLLPEDSGYKTVQFSSYDRASTTPDQPGWFSNSDGFGGATLPAFEQVLVAPDANGVGTYLVCDIQQPGAIVRLWTAKHTGTIKLYLDGAQEPLFDGTAEDFYWNLGHKLAPRDYRKEYDEVFRQYDAVYFPIVFAERCRIEWTGNAKEVHFYHVNARLFAPGTPVKTFTKDDYATYQSQVQTTYHQLKAADGGRQPGNQAKRADQSIAGKARSVLLTAEGEQVMNSLSLKVYTDNPERALRKAVLSIYFDDSPTPQVHFPIGDFFGAAPGVNPFESLPFSVKADGTMICRFPMPFQKAMKVEVENHSGEAIRVAAEAVLSPSNWVPNRSMHFYARWKIDHGLTASPTIVQDIPYLMARGTGRLVGASTLLFNPSPIPTGHGNWWGEGDEKITVDDEPFPSFFGTGSEDYYNYSWSSEKIFFHPYCGQPRDDGPSTRGFVTNFRWHVIDDIPFDSSISFFMELFSHTDVPDMTYARGVYFYARPGVILESLLLTADQLRDIKTPRWQPRATEGSVGFRFIEGEELVKEKKPAISKNAHYIWSDSTLVLWQPKRVGERITLRLPTVDAERNKEFALTMGMLPDGGKFKTYLNGKEVKLEGKDFIDLRTEGRTMLRTFWAVGVPIKAANNEIELEFVGEGDNNKIGIDFMWLKQ